MCRGYRVVHDGPFTFADGEVAESRWVTFDELGSASGLSFKSTA